jgi:thioester reductase-like protein
MIILLGFCLQAHLGYSLVCFLVPVSFSSTDPNLILEPSQDWTSSTPSAELPITSVEVVVGSGYAESKFVAERILELCAQKTSLRPVVVRCGQLSGAKNGFWNEREWFPALVRSGQVLGCFPRIQGVWTSLQAVANSVVF